MPLRRLPLLALAVLLSAPSFPSAWARTESVLPGPALQRAEAALARGDDATALIELKSAIKTAPDSFEPRLALGALLLRRGDSVAAEAELKQARQKGAPEATVVPLLVRALTGLGQADKALREEGLLIADIPPADRARLLAARAQAYLVIGKRDAALREVAEAEVLDPKAAGTRLARARINLADTDVDSAQSLVEAVIALDPRDGEAHALRGEILLRRNAAEAALAAYDSAVALRPSDVPLRLIRAGLLIAMGRGKEGVADIDPILKANPNQPAARLLKADFLARNNQMGEAWSLLQPAMAALSGNPRAQTLAAALSLSQGRPGMARSYAEAALSKSPDLVPALRTLAEAVRRQGDPDKAIAPLERALALQPDNPQMLGQLADILAQAGRLAEASTMMERAAALAPGDPALKTQLGLARLRKGDDAAAEAALTAVSGAQAKAGLALLHLRRGETAEAIKAAEQYRQLEPASALPDYLLAQGQAAAGNDAGVETALTSALAKDPAFAEAFKDLAALYHRQGRSQDEAVLYDAALKRDPGNVAALIGRAALAVSSGEPERAVRLFQDAVASQPGSVPLAEAQIDMLLRKNDRAAAVAAAKRIAVVATAQPRAHALLGRALLADGQIDPGLAALRRAADLAPGSGAARLDLARALLGLKRVDEARPLLDEATRLAPDLLPAWELRIGDEARRSGSDAALRLAEKAGQGAAPNPFLANLLRGDVLLGAGQASEAAMAFRAALDAAPDAGSLVMPRLNNALLRAGKRDEARAQVERWVRTYPSDAAIRLLFAEHLMVAGDTAGAIREYEQVLTRAPDNVVALNNLAYLYGPLGGQRSLDLARRAVQLAPGDPTPADTYGWLLVQGGRARDALALLEQAAAANGGRSPAITYHLAKALADTGAGARARETLRPLLGLVGPVGDDARTLDRKLGGG